MSKIKIIHVITDKNVGGAGKWLLNFLKTYDKNLLDVSVILPEDSLLNEQIHALNEQIIYIENMEEKSLSSKAIWQFYKSFKKYKPDIVHTHASLSARIGAKFAGVKCIINTKHCIENRPGSALKRYVNKAVNKIFSNKIIAVSKAVEQSMIDADISKNQIVTIYNGIEIIPRLPEQKINEIKTKYGISHDVPVVGLAARLEEVKDISTFIKAAGIILNEGHNIKFVIAGAGSMENKLKEETKKLNICENVIFTGYVKDIENLMNIFDIGVITSIQEALCLSIIESMSIGIPSVGTNSGGVSEVIIDRFNGRLVECKDYKALASAVTGLLEDKELYQMYSRNSIQHVKDNFLADDMTRKIEKLYVESRGEC